jgi:hypothetical protein
MIETLSQWLSHDPGTLPWLAVAGYLLAAGLCARQFAVATLQRERGFWVLAAVAMLALGINKQLDLQTSLTMFGRELAHAGGWYGQRRIVQAVFVMAAAVTGLIALAALGWLVRRLRPAVGVALLGIGLLCLFVLVRLASFHHVDVALRSAVLGVKLHTVLELAGIGLVVFGALMPARHTG